MTATYRGIITDWGGVLTPPLREGIGQWLERERIDVDHYLGVIREWVETAYGDVQHRPSNPVHLLERGEIDPREFERLLAAELRLVDGSAVPAEGMLDRMFHGFHPVTEMYDTLRDARESGLRTCLLSNSWGNSYPRDLFDATFDAVVISGEVRMRKPEPEIFSHALGAVGLPAEACVFIDDVEPNIEAAEALGMAGVLHRTPAETQARVAELCGMPVPSSGPALTD